MIGAVWLFAAVWSIIGIFKWELDVEGSIMSVEPQPQCKNSNRLYYFVTYIAVYVSSLMIMAGTYLAVLVVAIRQIRSIAATQAPFGTFQTDNIQNLGDEDSARQRKITGNKKQHRRKLEKEIKATKSVAIVYLAYLVCFFPGLVIGILVYFEPLHFMKVDIVTIEFVFYAFIEVLPVANCCINPFIYSFFNKQFRNAFKRVINKLTGRFMVPDRTFDSMTLGPSRKQSRASPQIIRTIKTSVTHQSIVGSDTPNLKKLSSTPINLSASGLSAGSLTPNTYHL